MSRHLSAEAGTTMRHVLHEVRTPLTQIMGFSEMLQEEARDRGQHELVPDLEQIRVSAQQLLDFLESVFRPDAPAAAEAGAGIADTPRQAATPRGGATDVASAPPEPSGVSGSLLVVDDEASNRKLLARRLSRLGYEVTAATDGREALRAIEEGSFELVLLDIIMPDTSGLEVLEAIRRTRPASELPVVMATALGASEDTVEALERGANDYVTKPYDFPVLLARVATQLSLRRAAQEIAGLAQELEIRNTFIRRAFGRYVSDEVVSSLLDNPAGLELRGEKRCVTILISDLRGFSPLVESLTATQVVSLLNRYLGTMAEVIQSHGGTIDEFRGDGILAFFGAPVSGTDDAARAVAAALAMQLAVGDLNERNRATGLPRIEMGIGIATGNAIVGNLGSEKRAKYGAVGNTVNLAARIESYSLGGDVLVDDATREAVGAVLRVDFTREVSPKGFAAPIRVHHVAAVGDVALPEQEAELKELARAIPLRCAFVEGKDAGGRTFAAAFSALSPSGARLRSTEALPELSNLRIELLDERGEAVPGPFYAKVIAGEAGLVRFTSRSSSLEAILDRALAR